MEIESMKLKSKPHLAVRNLALEKEWGLKRAARARPIVPKVHRKRIGKKYLNFLKNHNLM